MSKLFGRVIDIKSDAVRMNNTDLDIEFEVPFDDDLDPNMSEIGVYNLSQTTRNNLKNKQPFTLNAGYKEDSGLILSGRIVNTHTTPVGADRLTVIKVLDSVVYSTKKTLKKSYKKGIKADAILLDLAKIIGLKIAVIKLPKNIVYKKGYTIDGDVLKEMQKIASDCAASCYISRGQAYIRDIREGDNNQFRLNADTGLVGSPEPFEKEKSGIVTKGYKIKCLMQYRIHAGAIIYLEAVGIKATLRVKSGKHIAKGNTFYTEMEAIL